MALETREEFLTKWQEVSEALLGDNAEDEVIQQAGNELYDARVLAYNVAEDGLNLMAHRFFHGAGSVSLNFMMQLPLGEMLPFLVGEYMFHTGFVAGLNYGRDPDTKVGLSDETGAANCLGDRDTIIRTREELEAHLMPAPIEAVQELQRMIQAAAAAMDKKAPKEGEGSPIIPAEGEEGEGYF